MLLKDSTNSESNSPKLLDKKLVYNVKSNNAFRDKKPSAIQEHKIYL